MEELENGELLRTAEAEAFMAMLTGDRNISYRRNNKKRIIALIVPRPPDWQVVSRNAHAIRAAISRTAPGSYEVPNLKT